MFRHQAVFALLCAFVQHSEGSQLRSRTTSLSVPWPPLPSQQSYLTPEGPVVVYPVSVVKGLTSQSTNESQASALAFSRLGDTYTLDYGGDVAGKPTFSVTAVDDYAQIEVKFSEAYNGLLDARGDGPFAFSNGLAATFRVETFNITTTGAYTGYFIQGSQRWQSIKLVGGSSIIIEKAGFVSSVDQAPISSFPGYFASSNQTYTDIWALGPRTQQLNCFAPGTQTATWNITEHGAYIRGQKPASTAKVVNLANYTLEFETMIDYGGTGWRVDTEVDAILATGPIFVLTSDYPSGSFTNIDRSLVPPDTLILGRGWSLQNQTSLPGYVLDKFPLNMNVTEKNWHTIKTVSSGDGVYSVFLDSKRIAHFNISSYGIGDPNPYIPGGYYKSFAFGPWQDQAAYVRNVNVTSSTGENVYSNSMTSEDVLVANMASKQTTDMIARIQASATATRGSMID